MPKITLNRILPLLILFALVTAFIWFTFQPAKGTVRVTTNQSTSSESDIQTPPGDYSGKKISFSYPTSYYIQPNSSASSELIDRVVLLGEGIKSKKIAVTVKPSSTTSLSGVSAVQYRRMKPEIYIETQFDLAGAQGILFSQNKDGFEISGLAIKNGLLVSISLTSNSTGPILEQEFKTDFQTIVNSWIWK